MSRWFRFYDDALTDQKVQQMDHRLFKHWINCLCLASKNDGDLGTVDELARNLCRTPGMWLARGRCVVHALLERGLLERCGDHVTPHNWHHRQYKSDQSTQRVKEWRKRYSNVSATFQSGHGRLNGNVSETAQNRTDSKKEGNQPASALAEVARSPTTEQAERPKAVAEKELASPLLASLCREKGWSQ